MNYSALFSHAWIITWRYKFLWLLGFVAAITSTRLGSSVNFQNINSNGYGFFTPDLFTVALLSGPALLLWLAGLVARAGLIIAAAQLRSNQSTTLWQSLRGSIRFLLPLVGLTLVLYGPLAVIGMLIGLVIFNVSELAVVILILISFLVLFPLALVIVIVYSLAQRGIVLDGHGVLAAITHGWYFLRQHLGVIISIGFFLLLINIGFSMALSAITLPLMTAVLLPALQMRATTGTVTPGLIGAALGIGLMITALSAILVSYQSVVVTLTYLKISELKSHKTQKPKRKRGTRPEYR